MRMGPGPNCSPEDRIRLICDVSLNSNCSVEVKLYGTSESPSSGNNLIMGETKIQDECKTVRANVCRENGVDYWCCSQERCERQSRIFQSLFTMWPCTSNEQHRKCNL